MSRDGSYYFTWICPLYPCSVTYYWLLRSEAWSIIFLIFGMTRPMIEPRSPDKRVLAENYFAELDTLPECDHKFIFCRHSALCGPQISIVSVAVFGSH